jgi:ABC-2 type transport system ATP-binding protein
MPEERGLYPKMRIGEHLEYLARLSGVPRPAAASAATAWLERLGLGDRARDRLEALSHGNQQRVQLAAALVHDPELAVLDEPFSGLDPIGVRAMSHELARLAADGAAIVFSSHQLDLVEDICDDVVIVADGSVVTTGTLDELRSRAARRRLSVTVDGRPWQPRSVPVEQVGNGARAHLLVANDVSPATLLAEAQRDGDVEVFSYEPPSLTDIFHEAVAR